MLKNRSQMQELLQRININRAKALQERDEALLKIEALEQEIKTLKSKLTKASKAAKKAEKAEE
jgi:hypothetical protein